MWSIWILLLQLLLLAGRWQAWQKGKMYLYQYLYLYLYLYFLSVFVIFERFGFLKVSGILLLQLSAWWLAGGRRGRLAKSRARKKAACTQLCTRYTQKSWIQDYGKQIIQNLQKESTLAANYTGESNYNTAAFAL